MGGGTVEDSIWLHVARGKLNGKRNGESVAYDFYEGQIIGIERRTKEFEGKRYNEIVVTMRDGAEVARITFREKSFYALGFFSMVEKVDLSRRVRLGAWKKKDKDRGAYCWMEQDGQRVQRREDMPQPAEVKVGDETVQDWSAVLLEFQKILNRLNINADPPPAEEPF